MPAYRGIGQIEGDVEGQGLRFKDGEGNDWAIAPDRVKSITLRDVSGEEHEVEGHLYKRLEPADVEGHGIKARRDDGSEIEVEGPFKVKYTDDSGQVQEVEGHYLRRLDQEPDAEGHLYRK